MIIFDKMQQLGILNAAIKKINGDILGKKIEEYSGKMKNEIM